MVTILLGEQGAMIALSSHSDPPLIYFYLKRPVSSGSCHPLIYSDLRRPGSSHSGLLWSIPLGQRDEPIHTSRMYDINGPIITRGKAVLCIIGLWSFHRKKIADHVGPICSIVIMAPLRTLIRDDIHSFIHSFIHFEHFYSAPSRRLLRSAPDSSTAKKESF